MQCWKKGLGPIGLNVEAMMRREWGLNIWNKVFDQNWSEWGHGKVGVVMMRGKKRREEKKREEKKVFEWSHGWCCIYSHFETSHVQWHQAHLSFLLPSRNQYKTTHMWHVLIWRIIHRHPSKIHPSQNFNHNIFDYISLPPLFNNQFNLKWVYLMIFLIYLW